MTVHTSTLAATQFPTDGGGKGRTGMDGENNEPEKKEGGILNEQRRKIYKGIQRRKLRKEENVAEDRKEVTLRRIIMN